LCGGFVAVTFWGAAPDPAGGGGYAPPAPDPTRARGLAAPLDPPLCAAIASCDPLAPPELA